jgi:polar amino acid transport system substrate-binding protein
MKTKGICAFWVAILMAVLFITTSARLEARPLIIEGLAEAPLKWMEDGKPAGIDIDIMQSVLERMGITDFQIHLLNSGKRLLFNAQQGRSDIVLTLSRNKEREAYLDYPDEAHLVLDWRFVIRAEDRGRIVYNGLPDLRGLQIGAAAGFAYSPAFWHSDLDIQVVAKNDLLIPMLLQKRVDVVPVNYLSTLYETLRNGQRDKLAFLYPPLRRAPYYNVWSKASDYPGKDDFLKRYDDIIRTMRQDGTISHIAKAYLGDDGDEWWKSQYLN